MNSTSCIEPECLEFGHLIGLFSEVDDALARLDEWVRTSPIRDGLTARLAYQEACACRLADGVLVDVEDLVLFDHRVWRAGPRPDLAEAQGVLEAWRNAETADAGALLASPRPGESADAEAARACEDRIALWRTAVGNARSWPPLLAAAIAWDAWLNLAPEAHGSWKASLLGTLVLRTRGRMQSLLLPIDLGRRHSTYRRDARQSPEQRINGFLEWVLTGCRQAGKELDRLRLAEDRMMLRCRDRNSNSKLPALVRLLMLRPVVSIPTIAQELGVTQRGARLLLSALGSTPRELTGLGRYRVWGIG